MLIGAHVSPAGGPAKAVERGVERGCRSIQIFNQNPRQWAARDYPDEQIAEFHEAMEASDVDALLIHAVYLLNPASEDPDFREKTLASLITSLRMGAALGAVGVVLHPGSALKTEVGPSLERAAEVIREALAESVECPLHLENTAGAGGTLGRTFEELARLVELIGDDERVGICLDSCHLYASGYDIRDRGRLASVLDDFDAARGDEAARLAAHQRLGDGAGLQPRPARQPRRRRDRSRGVCRVPVRAPLRGPAVRARGPGREGQGGRRRRYGVGLQAAQAGRAQPSRLIAG